MKQIRDLFVARLAARGGERAATYFVRRWIYPTDGPEMAAHNAAVVETIESPAFAGLSPLERLAALEGFLRPSTQKAHHNALVHTPHYREAYERWVKARQEALRALPAGSEVILRDHLRAVLYRIRALECYPTAAIEAEVDGVRLALVRRTHADRWWAAVLDGSGRVPSRTYLRAGHLSPRALRLEARLQRAGDGTPVLSVLVDHARGCGRQECPLPAAMEFVYREGRWVPSLWREQVDPAQALLPHVGRSVRIGDLVLHAVTDDGRLEEGTPPDWRLEARFLQFMGRRHWCPICGVEPAYGFRPALPLPGEVVVAHPDHYPVRVEVEGDEIIIAHEAAGQTQYLPRDRVGD